MTENVYYLAQSRSCRFFHDWETCYDTGITKYQFCTKCSFRRIVQRENSGYQPIDAKFLDRGIDPKILFMTRSNDS